MFTNSFFNWLLSDIYIAFPKGLSIYGSSIFRYSLIVCQFPSSDEYISSGCTALVLPTLIALRSLVIYVSQFWKLFSFLPYFFSNSNSNFLFSFLQICEKCCSIFHVPLFLTNIVHISNDLGQYLFCWKCWLGYLSATQ